jgi:S-adenosylmethionine:tRNA ribosyltransferase-isomerase
MVKPSKKTKPGTVVRFGEVDVVVAGTLEGGLRLLEFSAPEDVARARRSAGELPLPPYVTATGQDPARYQTTYARTPGSVAAPTAGLHFEAEDFARLAEAGATIVDVSLEVGAGTFQPVREDDVRTHLMHSESYRIESAHAAHLSAAMAEGRRVVALGTTAMRVLESLPDVGWEEGFEGDTDLFVFPGYRFRRAQALVTNFHLPRSTLLMLVAAFAGREAVLRAYRAAHDAGFRFFSFGDCCWIR